MKSECEKTSVTDSDGSIFYSIPTSPATDIIFKVLGTHGKPESFIAANKKVNHSQEIDVLVDENSNKRQVIVKKGLSAVTLEISDIEKLTGNNKAAKKMFAFVLIKVNEQACTNGVLTRNYIRFPLSELTDIEYYSCPQSARKGFKAAMDILTSIKVMGKLHKGKNRKAEQSTLEVMFTEAYIKNSICTVFLNERIDWSFIFAFYTILPKYYFALPNRAGDLLYYIFYLARQNVRKIDEQGYFTISMSAIQQRLGLPDAGDTKNPQRDIINAIEAAIEAIENHNKDPAFIITPVYGKHASTTALLNNSYLKITLHGQYANDFIKLSKKARNQKQADIKRRQAIEDNAKAKNLAEKLARDENSQNREQQGETIIF